VAVAFKGLTFSLHPDPSGSWGMSSFDSSMQSLIVAITKWGWPQQSPKKGFMSVPGYPTPLGPIKLGHSLHLSKSYHRTQLFPELQLELGPHGA
jgi:hypothetical protein